MTGTARPDCWGRYFCSGGDSSCDHIGCQTAYKRGLDVVANIARWQELPWWRRWWELVRG
jgi:hypothetical protein